MTTKKFRAAIYPKNDELSGFEFDAVMSEDHTGDVDVTAHPVEGDEFGNIADIADHTRRRPENLNLKCIVSDTPIIALASIRAKPINNLSSPTERVAAAQEQLLEWKNKGVVLTVVTKIRTYSTMILRSTAIHRDNTTGDILDIGMMFTEILIAKTESVDSPVLAPAKTGRGKRKKLGKKPKGKPTAPVEEKTTVLNNIFTALGG